MPPAPGQFAPDSLATAIRTWFADHPGLHRCQEVAVGLGHTQTWAVANECGRLYRRGHLTRSRVPIEGRTTPVTYYAAAAEVHHRRPKENQA